MGIIILSDEEEKKKWKFDLSENCLQFWFLSFFPSFSLTLFSFGLYISFAFVYKYSLLENYYIAYTRDFWRCLNLISSSFAFTTWLMWSQFSSYIVMALVSALAKDTWKREKEKKKYMLVIFLKYLNSYWIDCKFVDIKLHSYNKIAIWLNWNK